MRYDLCTQRNGEAPRHDSEINRFLLATTVRTFSSCTIRTTTRRCGNQNLLNCNNVKQALRNNDSEMNRILLATTVQIFCLCAI